MACKKEPFPIALCGSWPPVAEARQAEDPWRQGLCCEQHSLWSFSVGNCVRLTFVILGFQAGKH